jgi:L-threonylcarbamoyladenylate synthase
MAFSVPSASAEQREQVEEAARIVRRGGVVITPTDTLFGLAADVFHQTAVRKIFSLKGRPELMAMPVLVADWEQALTVTSSAPDLAFRLTQRFWPGGLTLVLPKGKGISLALTGGRETVGVRMPDHWVPLALCRQVGPITGTSANASGAPDILSLDQLDGDLARDVDYIIRAGPVPKGVSSTVVEITDGAPVLLRQGSLPFEDVLAACT